MVRRTLSRRIISILALALLLTVSGVNSGVAQAAGYITLSRTSGPPGSYVAVYGSGFSANETGIVVTFDGTTVASGISASSAGSWSAGFYVPSSTYGYHTIGAYGPTTGSVTGTTFYVTGASTITISPTSGPPGTSVTITGSGFSAYETVYVTFDGNTVVSGISASSSGTWSSTYTIPTSSAAGSHTIGAYGSTTGSATGVTFTVLSATITVSPTSGAPGISVTVTGSGFSAGETVRITFDDTVVTSSISASSSGSWSRTFSIPSSASGSHTIGAYGSTTGSVTGVTFTVSPGLAISPTSGPPGTSITVTGAGFGASETGIVITFDGTVVSSAISASSTGVWNGTFAVPASTAGSHTIGAYGSTTTAGSVTGVLFLVGPGITISQTSGSPGGSITVTGAGFGANETGIVITFDGNPVASGIEASSLGTWSSTFTVPASAFGSHTIKTYGSVTTAGSISGKSIKITPSLSISPAASYVGGTVRILGFGFAPNSSLTFAYDDKEIPAEAVTTDATGSFSKSFVVPKSEAGSHTISVLDWQRNSAKATFTMDSTAPPVPNLTSPEGGARSGIVGGTTPTFRWSSVTDPSGVTYVLQVDTSSDFSQLVLEKTDISGTRYTLTKAEALSGGEYYWRVKAVDGAFNESAWSQPRLLKSGLMALWALVLIIVLVVAALGVGLYFALARPRARRREAVAGAGVEMSQVVPGQWRTIDAEEAARGRQLPWRLALPGPAKGVKTVSAEDQARLKVVMDFTQSLPLVEPGYTVDWLVDLIETGMGMQISPSVYEQLLKGELRVTYEPPWMHHPAYQDLTTLLKGQSILQDLTAFVDGVGRCASETTLLLQQIYRDAITEVPPDFLERGGWEFISAVYTDAMSWFVGKSLRDPSERDYTIKHPDSSVEGAEERWLYGEEIASFAGRLILAPNDKEALRLQALHLRLRRSWRNNSQARQVAAAITQLEMQRGRLLNVFSQFHP